MLPGKRGRTTITPRDAVEASVGSCSQLFDRQQEQQDVSKSRKKGGVAIEMNVNSPEPATDSPRFNDVLPDPNNRGVSLH